MSIKKSLFVVLISVFSLALSACGKVSYKDGSYEGEYFNEEKGSKTVVSINISDNIITECKATFYDSEGNEKGEDYGKGLEDSQTEKAQIAVKGMKEYAPKLVEEGSIDKMEAVSGATVSFKEFESAVKEALKKAEK